MIFKQLYSGSNGNLYGVTAKSGERLMIECGVSWKELGLAIDHNLKNIVGCLISHEHQDHCRSIERIIQSGINVYSGLDTFKALGLAEYRRAIRIRHKFLTMKGKSFRIMPFKINHDACEPFGFIIYEIETKEYMLFAIDTSHIDTCFDYPFSIIAIECSYERERLKDRVAKGEIPELVARRLLDSHMEKQATMRYIEKFCKLDKCSEIHLLHMSGDNINRKQTAKEFEDKFFIKTITI